MAHGWLPASLSVLALLMLRAYPKREYVHLSLAFLSWSVVTAIAPSITSVCFLALAATGLALALLVVERTVRPFESVICHRVGVVDAGYTQVVSSWVSALFGLAAWWRPW